MPRNDFGQRLLVASAACLAVSVAAWFWTYGLTYIDKAFFGNSNFGYSPDPDGTREFLRELERPTFRQAGAEVIAGAKSVDTYLYRYADRAHRAVYGKPFAPWDQGSAGTCVSFGWGLGAYMVQAVDWSQGLIPSPPLLVATEPIYGGSRTEGRMPPVSFAGWSDGSYGGAAARWVAGLKTGRGGIAYRKRYGEGDLDLTTYSTTKSRQWGAYGVPGAIAIESNKHTARDVCLCETWESLTAAIESGFCVPICSNVGFASGDRDADGFLRRAGNWGHCMLICCVKYAANSGKNSEPPMQSPRDGVLVVNSWGSGWVRGGKHPPDQPDGSFWISRADAEAILRQGDSFVIGGVGGFKYRDLHNGNWMESK
jgi:hypothetical protein